jgi:DNA-binding NtrC family response regulator
MSPDLEKYFVEYDWPGNVRQLKNALESMAAMAKNDTLTRADLPPTLSTEIQCDEAPAPRLDHYTLAEIEKMAILQTLEKCHGNRVRAARQLGISVRTLQRKLRIWNRPALPATPASVGMAWESFNPLPA